jgi:hypothetical protein
MRLHHRDSRSVDLGRAERWNRMTDMPEVSCPGEAKALRSLGIDVVEKLPGAGEQSAGPCAGVRRRVQVRRQDARSARRQQRRRGRGLLVQQSFG